MNRAEKEVCSTGEPDSNLDLRQDRISLVRIQPNEGILFLLARSRSFLG